MADTPSCPHRGKIFDNGSCFCRHPHLAGPDRKSTAVSLAICQACPVPTGSGSPPAPTGQAVPLQVAPDGGLSLASPAGGPGSELLAIYRSRGIPGCQLCYELAGRMDDWGPDGCRDRLDAIVAEIFPRARRWADGGKFAKHAPDVAIRIAIRRDVNRAIRRARQVRTGA